MSDETTTAAPAAETAAPGADLSGIESTATAAPDATEDHGLDAETVEALAGDGDLSPDDPDTITLGEHTIPLSALSELPDDVLKRIKRKVKAAGEEREISLLDALEAVPRAEGWQRRQWEAAQYEKRLRDAAAQMKRDPIGAAMKLYDVSRAEAIDILANPLAAELEEAQLSPEERAERQRRRDLEERARRADEYERREQEQRQAAEVKRAEQAHMREVGSAIKAAGLPESRHTVGRIATVLTSLYDEGILRGDQAPSPEHYKWAAEQVQKEIAEERAPMLSDPDRFIESHPEAARAIARAYAQRVKARQAPPEREPGTAPRQASSGTPKFESFQEWQAWADRRMGIG